MFKQAIATGWDCPRAKILVKLREGGTERFNIQTVGRIRRMPLREYYGHIDNTTPSLAMSVFKEYRGLGVGTALLEELIATLKSKGYSRISLSVQKDNYAVKMYQQVGFTILKEVDEEYIMVIAL